MKHVIKAHQIAFIREEDCIGCTKCIQACPVDAIVGASKLMHTVLRDICTGCELCIPPCPVDCIDLPPSPHLKTGAELIAFTTNTEQRIQKKQTRLADINTEENTCENPPSLADRKALIADIMRRKSMITNQPRSYGDLFETQEKP